MLTWALMAICRVQLIMAHISVPTYVWDVSHVLWHFPLQRSSVTDVPRFSAHTELVFSKRKRKLKLHFHLNGNLSPESGNRFPCLYLMAKSRLYLEEIPKRQMQTLSIWGIADRTRAIFNEMNLNEIVRRVDQQSHLVIRLCIWCRHKAVLKDPCAGLWVGHTCSADVKVFL